VEPAPTQRGELTPAADERQPDREVEKTGIVVAIDGPAGAGKTTLARRLAEALGLPFVSTGLMYRALAELALQKGIDPEDGPALAPLASTIAFSLGGGPVTELLIDGRQPDPSLTSSGVEALVSRVARHPEVRAVLRAAQRRLGAAGGVMEGRDIGTAVFPDADVKIFLSALPAVRAGRREEERGGGKEVADAVAARDSLDARTNPLVPAGDAHVLDTTVLSRDEAFEEALGVVLDALKGDRG
jgi:cytidylate kinase